MKTILFTTSLCALALACGSDDGGSQDATAGDPVVADEAASELPDDTAQAEAVADTASPGDHDPFGNCWNTPKQTCTGVDEYVACLKGKCKTAFDDASAKCTTLTQCQNACPCDANFSGCSTVCAAKNTMECMNAAMAMGDCSGTNCQSLYPKCTQN